MSINFPGTITGAAVTGLTSPTYTTTADTSPPDVNCKQVAILAFGGTQTGLVTHSVSSPFTLSYWKPKLFSLLGRPSPITGVITSVPINKHKFICRKGVLPAANQPSKPMVIRVEMDIPAGAETYDKVNIAAAISATSGALSAMASGISDTINSGVM